jgi:hypothetical protein
MTRCSCGRTPATVVPEPMCEICARDYFVQLLAYAAMCRPLEKETYAHPRSDADRSAAAC